VLVPVIRSLDPVPAGHDVQEAVLTAALESLFAGPADSERAQGLLTLLPTGASLRRVDIESDVAYVDVSGDTETGAVPETLSLRAAQIVATALELPAVREVVLMVDGEIVGPGRPFGAGGPAPDRFTRSWIPVPIERPVPAAGRVSKVSVGDGG